MKIFHKIFSWYFSKKALPYWIILIIDCGLLLFSLYLIEEMVEYEISNSLLDRNLFWTNLMLMGCYVIGFRLFHTYAGVIRFSSFIDLCRVAIACICGCILSFCILPLSQITEWFIDLPSAVLFLSCFISICFMWAFRISVKIVYEGVLRESHTTKIFIYGVKEGGVAIAKSINNSTDSPYVISGFVSDCSEFENKYLMGVKVYSNSNNLIKQMRDLGVNELLVSPLMSETFRNDERMVNSLIENGIKILMMPSAQEWDGKSDFTYKQLKEVNIEDLLPREKIEVDMKSIGNFLVGKRILITGAAGSIGSELVCQISLFQPSELVLVDQAETPLHDIRLMMEKNWPNVNAHTIVGDIANMSRMEKIFERYKPEFVFHAAAYKHVPMMEDNPYESIENNVLGTKIIADLSVKFGVKKFVMVSTDKAVNPTNVMGCSKRICEIYVQSFDKAIKKGEIQGETQFVTTRFGNVLGSNGSVIPLFWEQIKAGGPVTVTHPEIIRFFMLIPEACKLVLEAGTMGKGGEIYVFDMGKPVKIADLARKMILLSGVKGVEIKFTGLRDGEKLYEELLNDEEKTLPTFHPKIKIAQVREYDYLTVDKQINELISYSNTNDDMGIVKLMKQLVPEFKSQHSIYEKLDNIKN